MKNIPNLYHRGGAFSALILDETPKILDEALLPPRFWPNFSSPFLASFRIYSYLCRQFLK